MAKKRNVVYVSPNKERDRWDVQREGTKKDSKHFETKDPAIDFGKKLAKSEGPGQLKIQKHDGKLQTEYTYEKDPSPPKG